MSYYKYYKGRRLGPYTNKLRHHQFSVKDVARIAKIVSERENDGGIVVLAAVASALGLGWLFCRTSRSINSALSIHSFLKELAVILAGSTLTKVILQTLIQAKLIAPPSVRIICAVGIAAISLIDSVIEAIAQITSDMDALKDVSKTIDNVCEKIQESIGGVIDGTCDATGETCETAKQLGNGAAWQLKSDAEKAFEILNVERYPNWWEWL